MKFTFFLLFALFMVVCLFMAGLILIQRGRGGGLASAFGGAGGNTAFGSKTGDVLTWTTAVVFVIFMLMTIGLNKISERIHANRVTTVTGITPGSPQGATTGPTRAVPTDQAIPATSRAVPSDSIATTQLSEPTLDSDSAAQPIDSSGESPATQPTESAPEN